MKILYEKCSTKTLTAEAPYRPRVTGDQFINIETYPGWLELPLIGTSFMDPGLFEPLKLYCILR